MGFFGAEPLGRSGFYDGMATALDAGLGAREALATLGSRGSRIGAAALAVERRVSEDRVSLSEAMGEDPRAWSVFERRVVEAGERGGRLPAALRRLALHFERRGRARDRIGLGLIYPVGLLHAAFFLPPLKYLVVEGDPLAYARAAFLPLAVLWVVVAAIALLWRAVRASEAGRRATDAILLSVPVVGGTVRSIATLEYATTLGALHASGIPAMEAMSVAAAATRNRVYAAAGARAAERLRQGDRMYEALASEPSIFPRLLIEAVHLGETSGKLDETLDRVERTLREETDRRVTAISVAVPVVGYLAVVGFIAYTVISFYTGYFAQIRDLTK